MPPATRNWEAPVGPFLRTLPYAISSLLLVVPLIQSNLGCGSNLLPGSGTTSQRNYWPVRSSFTVFRHRCQRTSGTNGHNLAYSPQATGPVSYTHLTLPTNREV